MRQCHFCTNNLREVDYKDAETLKQFLDAYARINKQARTGLCTLHQRRLAQAVKRARELALIPYSAS